MHWPNDSFEKLSHVLAAYCKNLRGNLEGLQASEHKLKKVFKETLPELSSSSNFTDDIPDHDYVRELVSYAVKGLNNESLEALWEHCFVLNSTIADVSKQLSYSESSISRLVRSFPERLASQLWEKNHELIVNPSKIAASPLTTEQRQITTLKDALHLSDRQAEILLLYVYTLYAEPHLSRKDIAKKLFISTNTLKAHIRNIIRKTSSNTMTDAAKKAAEVLRTPANAVLGIGSVPLDLEERAQIESVLERTMVEILDMADPDQLPRKIDLLRFALSIVDRNVQPEFWAALHGELANSINQSLEGDIAENQELAIYHYQQTLYVYNLYSFPVEWTRTQKTLGDVYAERIRGDRAENVEFAIRFYKHALEVISKDTFQIEWADIHYNLAVAYTNRMKGVPAENVNLAIQHYQQALEVFSRSDFPTEWAKEINESLDSLRSSKKDSNCHQGVTSPGEDTGDSLEERGEQQ